MIATEWVKVPGLDTIMNVVCRTSNRAFVGAPLCEQALLIWALTFF